MIETIDDIKAILGLDVESGAGELIAAAVCEWANCEGASVHETGSIWIEGPQRGHWLSDAKIIEFWNWNLAQAN